MFKSFVFSCHQLLIVLILTIFGCNIQDNKNLTEEAGSPTISIDSTNLITQSTKEYIDPLFFINGQLCQHLREIHQDKSGTLWFGTNVYGIMHYSDNKLEYYNEKKGLKSERITGRITGIVEDNEGNIWFGTFNGLLKYNPNEIHEKWADSFEKYTEKDGLINNEIWSLTIDHNGIFWIGTMEGISQFDGENFADFPIPQIAVKDTTTILSYNRINCILEDKKGTIWIGTDGFGICKYNPPVSPNDPNKKGDFERIIKEDGLCGNNIANLLEDKNGNIWIGTMYGGISKYDGNSFTNYNEKGIVEGVETTSIYEAKNGDIWFSSEGYGVYKYDGTSFTNYHENEGLATHGILSIFEDEQDRFWFGGWGGLFRYDSTVPKNSGKSFYSVTKDGSWD